MNLTTEQRSEVLRLRQSGATYKYISNQVGCSVEGARQLWRRSHEQATLEGNTERFIRQQTPPAKIRIDEIAISTRAFRALNTLGVIYLSEIPEFTDRDFLRLRGISRKTLWEINERVLQPFHLTLKRDE